MFLKAVGSDAYLGLWIWLKVYFMPALVCVCSQVLELYISSSAVLKCFDSATGLNIHSSVEGMSGCERLTVL